MAITCPQCGSEFDATLFEFGHRVRCRCGTEVEYPGTDLRAGHVITQSEDEAIAHEDRCIGGMQAASGQPQQDSKWLFQIARSAAEQLVTDLDRARQFTGQWADKKLTEVLVDAALSASLHRLAETGCWGEANRLPSQEFWRVAGSLLELGSLQRHARLKPRGYAGDYLPDETAAAMLRFFWGRLAEGGVLLVGNFAPHNPTRACMEWIGNWYLTYRTSNDLQGLAVGAGVPQGKFSVGSEGLGVNLILTVRK